MDELNYNLVDNFNVESEDKFDNFALFDTFDEELPFDYWFEGIDEAEDETTEIESTSYATWIAEMDAKLKAAIAEDELDINDDFYAEYKGVVKPRVYFNGVELDTENQQTYDELVDNYKPIYPIYE